MTTTEQSYSWRHGWVPLTMRAALAKAHGNHKQAEKLLGAAREARAAKREAAARSFVTPNPAHQAEHAAATKRAAAARRKKVWRAAINTPPPAGRTATGFQASRNRMGSSPARPAAVMPSGGAFAERAKKAAADPGVNLRAGNVVSVRGDNAGTVTKVTGGWLSKPYPGGDAAVWKTRNEAIGALALLHASKRRR